MEKQDTQAKNTLEKIYFLLFKAEIHEPTLLAMIQMTILFQVGKTDVV